MKYLWFWNTFTEIILIAQKLLLVSKHSTVDIIQHWYQTEDVSNIWAIRKDKKSTETIVSAIESNDSEEQEKLLRSTGARAWNEGFPKVREG